MELSELTAGLDVEYINSAASPARICDLTEDSKTVVPGSLFIARSGLKVDGKSFVEAAAAAGAAAILTDDRTLTIPGGYKLPIVYSQNVPLACAKIAERFYGFPTRHLRLAAVTGTNGKSTITYLIWQLMNHAKVRCGLIGTVIVDDGAEIAPAMMTTPPAIELSRSLSMMHEAGCAAAALEISSHALDQHRADALRLCVAIFTNLTGDHLDYHKSMENYAAAKARLFELLPAEGTAIVNDDDPHTPRMLRDCKARILRCALNAAPNEADPAERDECRATVMETAMSGMSLAMEGPWGLIEAQIPLIGRYNAMNILQAVAACHVLGLSREQLALGLPKLSAPPGRLECISTPADDITVFVDYAHSDDSLRNCLDSIERLIPGRAHGGAILRNSAGSSRPSPLPPRAGPNTTGQLWVVFGCGGDKDTTKRPRMGAVASEIADIVVITSDNPRTERPGDIVDQILSGIPKNKRDHVIVQIDRGRAIAHAIEHAKVGDVVVIAGKGHETDQILPDGSGGTIKIHFDDREVAGSCLHERRDDRDKGPDAPPASKPAPRRPRRDPPRP